MNTPVYGYGHPYHLRELTFPFHLKTGTYVFIPLPLKREIALCLSAITASDCHSSIPFFFVATVGTRGGVTNLISRPEAVEKRPK